MKRALINLPSVAVWKVLLWCNLLSFLSPVTDAAGNAPETVSSQLVTSVVVLDVERKDGSRIRGLGFLAIDSRIAVTTWDLVEDAIRVVARFETGEAFGVSGLIDKDEKRNVALVRIKVFGRPLLELAAREPVDVEKTYVVGAAEGEAFKFVDGRMNPVEIVDGVRVYPLGAAVSAGSGGGPLVDESGRVIGIVAIQSRGQRVAGLAIPSVYALGLDHTLPTQPWQEARPLPSRPETAAPGPADAPQADPNAIRFRFYRADEQRFSDANRNLWTESILWWTDNIKEKCGGNPRVDTTEDMGVDTAAIPSSKARFTTRTTGWESWVLGKGPLKKYIAKTERNRDFHIGVFQEVRHKPSPEEKSHAVVGVHAPPNVLAIYFKATRIREVERVHFIGYLFGLDGGVGGVMSSRYPRGPGSPPAYGNITEWPSHWCQKIAEHLDQ